MNQYNHSYCIPSQFTKCEFSSLSSFPPQIFTRTERTTPDQVYLAFMWNQGNRQIEASIVKNHHQGASTEPLQHQRYKIISIRNNIRMHASQLFGNSTLYKNKWQNEKGSSLSHPQVTADKQNVVLSQMGMLSQLCSSSITGIQQP